MIRTVTVQQMSPARSARVNDKGILVTRVSLACLRRLLAQSTQQGGLRSAGLAIADERNGGSCVRFGGAPAVPRTHFPLLALTEVVRLYKSAHGRFVDAKLTNPVPDRAAALGQPDRQLGVGSGCSLK